MNKDNAMKCVQKIVITSLVSLALAQNALAEESGVFVGIGDGVGVVNKSYYVGYMWGILVGYKQFFSKRVGLRYYLNLNNTYFYMAGDANMTAGDTKVLHYSANMDLLGNFVSKENIDFGAFVGVGAGVDMWSGGAFSYAKHNIFNAALNIGLRVNVAKHHGIELAQRVQYNPIVENGVSTYYPSITGIRYTFSFGSL